ncbi:MAG: ribose ABC transporter permease [Lachnospiraceae bacterium]|nr:ribose ABC transporter permease [Lachnospiraceae bacterium]MDD3794470.1 ribose ABC transporter permease [Lachnospiraceae bacterium]
MKKLLKNPNITRKIGIIASLLVLMVVFTALTNKFFSVSNFLNILQQAAINLCVAVGMTFVIITGGIDLSVGSVMALSGMIMAMLMEAGVSPVLAVLIGLFAGAAFGAVNGLMIAKLSLQPFLVTLGTMSAYRGITLIISNGLPVRGFSTSYVNFMNSLNGIIPFPIVLSLILALIALVVLRYFKFGQYLFAVGGNEEATRLSGINTAKIKILTYALSGFTSTLAAVIFLGRLGAADPQAGNGYEMNAIAAAAIGGASLAGGKGSIVGTIIGCLILQTLNNGLTLLNVQSFYQTFAIGIIVLIATIIDRYSSK